MKAWYWGWARSCSPLPGRCWCGAQARRCWSASCTHYSRGKGGFTWAERLKRIGTGTILLPNRPGIAQTAAIVGKKEGEGPLHSEFDAVIEDDLFGEETWEKAESRFHYTAADTCLKKAGATPESVDVTLGGDLLNQIMAASTAAQKLQTPFLGIYGACSTMAETLCIGAMLCDGGYARRALCCASSHFCSAERQYRFPLEYGNQRPPTSQWTVTGAGVALLDTSARRPICRATHVTLGRIVDLAIKDMNNMGAAMAPAAADTLRRHLMDTGQNGGGLRSHHLRRLRKNRA